MIGMTYGPFYLLDHPPASRQFYTTRNARPTWGVTVHTSEGPSGPGSARALAGFISRRSDPGSYAAIVDSGGETVMLVPDEYTTFSVAASGYNSRTWAVCLAGRTNELSAGSPDTQRMIDLAGAAIVAMWRRQGIDPVASARWIGSGILDRPGLSCHGDVQPWDRSDAWSRHPERPQLDQLLLDAIERHAGQDDDMKSVLVLDPNDGRTVWECWGLFRKHITTERDRDIKIFTGSQYLDGSTDVAFRQFCLDTTKVV